eukprot:3004447-Pyramimonas_sp.AAC.1
MEKGADTEIYNPQDNCGDRSCYRIMLTSNNIKHAEHGHGGLTTPASAITSVWQGCGILTRSVCRRYERAAGPWDSHCLSCSRVRNVWQGRRDRLDFDC